MRRDKRKKTGKVAKGSRHGAPRRYLPRNWWPWCSVPPGLELCFSNYRGYMSVYHEWSMRIMPLSRPLHALSVHFRWFLIRWILWLHRFPRLFGILAILAGLEKMNEFGNSKYSLENMVGRSKRIRYIIKLMVEIGVNLLRMINIWLNFYYRRNFGRFLLFYSFNDKYHIYNPSYKNFELFYIELLLFHGLHNLLW